MLVLDNIKGKKIYLSNLDDNVDFHKYASWLNDPETNKFLESKHLGNFHEENLMQFVNTCNKAKDVILWGIYDLSGQHIGNIKAGPINVHHKYAEIGILLGEKSVWGCGISTEAIGLASNYLFEKLSIKKIIAGAYENNKASIRAFQKNGFEIEGCQKNLLLDESGRRRNRIILGLLC